MHPEMFRDGPETSFQAHSRDTWSPECPHKQEGPDVSLWGTRAGHVGPRPVLCSHLCEELECFHRERLAGPLLSACPSLYCCPLCADVARGPRGCVHEEMWKGHSARDTSRSVTKLCPELLARASSEGSMKVLQYPHPQGHPIPRDTPSPGTH